MDYSVGSIADLISNETTPNKIKVIEKKIKVSTPLNKSTSLLKSEGPKKKTQTTKRTKQSANSLDMSPKDMSPKSDNSETPLKLKNKPSEKLTNAEKRIKAKKSKQNVMAKLKHDMYKDRTVFVGNVAIGTTKTQLMKRFSVYGRIESIRFRSVPVPDEKTPKKLAAIKQQFHKNRTSLHSYIKFVTAEDSQKALVENGNVYDDHHIRVSHCNDEVSTNRDDSKAVFVGNMSFDCEEEDLWIAFAECGPIESVRIVRDRRTSIGKGFGYVNFTSADAVQMALEQSNVTVRNRLLRIAVCDNNHSKGKKQKTQKRKLTKSSESAPPTKKVKSEGGFQGVKFTDLKKKKKLDKGIKQKLKVAKLFTPRTSQS